MTKRYDEEIEVTTRPWNGSAPASFRWRGRLYDVDQCLATWREAGEWWRSDGGRDRIYHRILARPSGALATGDVDSDGFMVSPGAVYDVYLDRARDAGRARPDRQADAGRARPDRKTDAGRARPDRRTGWRLARVWD